MSLPLRKRTVHFYEISVQSRTRKPVMNPSCARLDDLLACCAKLAKGHKLPVTIRKSASLHTVLADWSYDAATHCYELLISKANAALSDVALRTLGTTSLRKAGKTKAEGIEVSAHVLIRPNPDGKTAAMLLTMGAGVSAGDVEVLLRRLCDEASKDKKNGSLFDFDDPSGAKDEKNNPLKYRVRYGFTALGHQGQTLASALQSGEFEGMELIAYEQTKFDAGGNLQIVERSLGVKANLPKAVTGASIRNAVGAFMKGSNVAPYDRLRIRYKTAAGKSSAATLKIADLDGAFTMKDVIEFDTDVEAQQTSLSPTILAGMRQLL